MHVARDLGFSSLVVLVLVSLLAPAIGIFVIRRKWRLAVARKEEIRRLLVMASEEAARAELEATYTASYSSVTLPKNTYQCAVCYSPTTTRCSRCKAVRYCSGKCQIIHWRQGHKEECHPPNTNYHNNDDKSGIVWRTANQEPYQNFDDRWENESVETSFKESVLSDSSRCTGVPHLKVDSDAHENVCYSTSESSDSSFSGFSTPSTGSKSSDESSVSESICSSEAEGSDRLMAADIASDMNASRLSSADQAKPVSPKFASLANSVDKYNKLKKVDPSKSCRSERDNCFTSSRSSDHSISTRSNDTIPKLVKTSSANDSSSNVRNDTTVSSFGGAVDSKLSNSESFLQFKFNLSGNSLASHKQSTKLNDTMLDDASPSALGISKPINDAALLESNRMDVPKVPSALSTRSEKSNHNKFTDSNVSNSCELKYERSNTFKLKDQMSNTGGDLIGSSASKFCASTSSTTERADVACSDPVMTARPAKFQLSSGVSQTYLASSVSEDSVSGTRPRKAENIGDAVTSPQGASFSPSSINGLKSSVLKVVDQIRGPKYGRHIDKGLFPYDLFVKLYTSNKVEMQPCGLINCGNSCYANAVLQCLAFTPPLTAYFVQGLHSKACSRKEWCFTCEFENLILKAKGGKSPISPDGIISQLKNIGSQLGHGREEDAHEFLRYAIDAMQSVCLKEAGVNAVGSFEEETTLIGLTFGGYLRSKIKCMKCFYKSERQERMMDLTVEIEGDVARLEDALRRFTATEILDGDNKYECSRCKSYEKAKKKFTIVEAPNVLTIALKRFQSGKFGKLNKSIRFPEILDLAPYMSGTSDKSPIYRLYGVVVHLDIMNASFSGHYVCYVKNIQNKWFKIDDSTVTAVELEGVLTKGAYMLLYARCSPRAPRLMRNRSKGNYSGVNSKNLSSNSRCRSTHPSVVQLHPSSIPQDAASVESFFLKFHRLQKILEEDSSSDNFSFTSSNSDEGSYSTDSTRDSSSTDDLSDYIFGGWGNSWRNMPDADSYSSSSSSPSYSRHSTDANSDLSAPGSLNSIRYQADRAGSAVEDVDPWGKMPNGRSKSLHMDGRRGDDHFLQSDTLKQCRKLVDSNSCREEDLVRLGYVKSGVSLRRSTSERTS